jgi:hypothetical protein
VLSTNYQGDIGDIPRPAAPELQALAAYAGLLCFHRFPYFPLRYGERGAAFAVRDANYLVLLREYREEDAIGQIEWTAQVLSPRGMPSWLLETQLHYVEWLLARRGYEVGPLPLGRMRLAARRLTVLPQETMVQAGLDFARRSGLPPWRKVRETGMLIAAAWADEKNAIGTPTKFMAWMTDPALFPPVWCAAVRAVYADFANR